MPYPVDEPFSFTSEGNIVCPAPIFNATIGTLATSTMYGQKPAAQVPAGGQSVIAVSLVAPSGRPAVLSADSDCGPSSVVAKVKEVLTPGVITASAALNDTLDSAWIALPIEAYNVPGVYDAEARVNDDAGNVIAYARATVYVDPSLFQEAPHQGLPSIEEIRNAVRDYPKANKLLGDYEYSVSEIASAVSRAVSRWNNTPPPLAGVYATTATWWIGSKANLLDGILAELYEMAGAYFRRGHLPYSAGGLQVDDMAKFNEYLQAASYHRKRFDEWTVMVRTRTNMEQAFGSAISGYSFSNW